MIKLLIRLFSSFPSSSMGMHTLWNNRDILTSIRIYWLCIPIETMETRDTLKESFKLRVSSKLKYYMEFIKNQIISLTINFLIDTMHFLFKNIVFTPRVDTLNLLGYFREYLGRYPHFNYIKNNFPIRNITYKKIMVFFSFPSRRWERRIYLD